MIFLLDTNVCIAFINNRSDRVRARFNQARLAGAQLTTSPLVVHELWYGVAKSQKSRQTAEAVTAFLSRYLTILEYSMTDAQTAGEIRADLERQGKPIGAYDTLIAGQALARNLILVTGNTREFARVPGLKLEDWSL
jgi:tRNA(fMet)-specific endonuclease VapC